MTETTTKRPMRADALRNRSRILEAAEAVFAAQGVAVPVDEVAAKAGVGVGTLYRHFPTKEALFEAIVLSRLDTLVGDAVTTADAPRAAEALFAYLQRFASTVAQKHDLLDALARAGIDLKANCEGRIEVLQAAVDQLAVRAADEGEVRNDLTGREMMKLVMGVSMLGDPEMSEERRCQLVSVICDGLRTQPGTKAASER